MKKNEMLSEEVLEKVSAGEFCPSEFARDIINNSKSENTTAEANTRISTLKSKQQSSTATQEWFDFGGTAEVSPLKTESHDLHVISENALQNQSNPHKRRIP